MSKIGLIDVDGHRFPNLALMRLSAFHKDMGDDVEWWMGDLFHYDTVYMSKIFSSAYSPDLPEPLNADRVIKGGSGYCISLSDGHEVFDCSANHNLPPQVEKMFPDYSIYPQYEYAVSMTSRGCPRGCSFCHVAAKEGRKAVKVANVDDFYAGQKEIKVLDPNITALPQHSKTDLFLQYQETGAQIDFSQGLDIRLLTGADVEILNTMRLKNIHFAWDNPRENLEPAFRTYSECAKRKPHGRFGTVYVLCGYNSTIEEDLHRIYTLRDLKYDPYVMLYNKPSVSKQLRDLQRWVNNRIIFGKCKRFEDYSTLK